MIEPESIEMRDAALVVERQMRLQQAIAAAGEADKSSQGAFAYRFIAISRDRGSLGNEVVRLLAEQTQWQVFDKEIVEFIARNSHVRESIVRELDERSQNLVHDAVERLLRLAEGESFGEEDYRRALLKTLAALAARGGVIIVGHGAPFAFDNHPSCLRVRVTASVETRLRRLCAAPGMTEEKARKHVQESDRELREFVRRHFGKNREDVHAFDLVVNTDFLSPERIAAAVLMAMKNGKAQEPGTGQDR